MLELIEWRRTTNQIYGDGVFNSILADEVKECLNALKIDQLSNNKIHRRGDNISEKVGKVTLIDLDSDSKDSHFESSKRKTFADAVKDNSPIVSEEEGVLLESIPLKPITNPKVTGGNLVVQLDAEEFKRGVEHLKYSVLGKLSLQRGDVVPTTMEIKAKLVARLQVETLQVIVMGKGIYHLRLNSLNDQCKVIAIGSMYLKPGLMRFKRWLPRFNTSMQIQSTSQVWIRVYNLPLKFWQPRNLLNIAMGGCTPDKNQPPNAKFTSRVVCSNSR